jgi:hypothetical protein
MTYKIIEKFTLNEKFSFSSLKNKSNILALDPSIEIDMYKAVASMLFVTIEPRGEKFRRHFYIGNDTQLDAYLIAFFHDKTEWDNMVNSEEMELFIPLKTELFSTLGWQQHGYRVIPDNIELVPTYDDTTNSYNDNATVSLGSSGEITLSQAEEIWNASTEYPVL